MEPAVHVAIELGEGAFEAPERELLVRTRFESGLDALSDDEVLGQGLERDRVVFRPVSKVFPDLYAIFWRKGSQSYARGRRADGLALDPCEMVGLNQELIGRKDAVKHLCMIAQPPVVFGLLGELGQRSSRKDRSHVWAEAHEA